MSLFYKRGSADAELSSEDLRAGLVEALDKIGPRKEVLAIPPDYTRFHSFAGKLTKLAWQYYGERLTDILPALGTHTAMTSEQISHMFGNVPKDIFRVHDWRNDVVTLGTSGICQKNFRWQSRLCLACTGKSIAC